MRAQRAQFFLHAVVAAVDEAHAAYLGHALAAQRRHNQRRARAQIGRVYPAAGQPVKSVLGNKKPAAATGTSAVEEIKKYKELLDAGVITQEEFSAKKKQLMGI